jgi:hypothetical protein
MADNIEFVDGLIVKAPNPKAPDFVKASISIKVADLGVWLRAKHKAGEEWVNIDVKESKAGKWYAAVSNFKPKPMEDRAAPEPKKPAGKFDDLDDDIPFSPLRKLESSVL